MNYKLLVLAAVCCLSGGFTYTMKNKLTKEQIKSMQPFQIDDALKNAAKKFKDDPSEENGKALLDAYTNHLKVRGQKDKTISQRFLKNLNVLDEAVIIDVTKGINPSEAAVKKIEVEKKKKEEEEKKKKEEEEKKKKEEEEKKKKEEFGEELGGVKGKEPELEMPWEKKEEAKKKLELEEEEKEKLEEEEKKKLIEIEKPEETEEEKEDVVVEKPEDKPVVVGKTETEIMKEAEAQYGVDDDFDKFLAAAKKYVALDPSKQDSTYLVSVKASAGIP